MFQFDKRMVYLILGIVVVMGLVGFTQARLMILILTLPGLLIAITFHEFAHAFVADKLGDDTPSRQGRLNLNPLTHMDPVGTVLLLFAGFGWGKPVEINPRKFDRKFSMETGQALVSIAGPLMNFLLAIILTIVYYGLNKFNSIIFLSQTGIIIETIISTAIMINIGLGVFNLLPLPPLDGSKIFIAFMPYKAKEFLYRYEQIFYVVFILLWISGAAAYIITPINTTITEGLFFVVGKLFGV